jgi:hypothetical protein
MMQDLKIQFCLLPEEETKAFMAGHGIPTPYKCLQEQCVAFDCNRKWCNHYNSSVEYKTESEE